MRVFSGESLKPIKLKSGGFFLILIFVCLSLLRQACIDRDRKLLLQQLTVVSKRVFRLILERQTSCSMELEQIVAVQVSRRRNLCVIWIQI